MFYLSWLTLVTSKEQLSLFINWCKFIGNHLEREGISDTLVGVKHEEIVESLLAYCGLQPHPQPPQEGPLCSVAKVKGIMKYICKRVVSSQHFLPNLAFNALIIAHLKYLMFSSVVGWIERNKLGFQFSYAKVSVCKLIESGTAMEALLAAPSFFSILLNLASN